MRRSREETAQFLAIQAERMRHNPTPAEAKLWEKLKPLGWKRQYEITGETKNGGRWAYILDFYHPRTRICIEVDGGIHKKHRGRDRRRDTRLATIGIRTLRITNRQVMDGTAESVCGRSII